MSGAAWAAAAALLLHLNGVGALPKEVSVEQVRARLATQPVRVLIFHAATSLSLRPSSATIVEAGDSGRVGTVPAGEQVSLRRANGEVILRGSSAHASGPDLLLRPAGQDAPATLSGRGGWGTRGRYPGLLEFRATPAGVDVIEHVDLESYTAGVVAAEVPRSFPLEAMKAQAVAARTYTAFHLADHGAEGADLCSRVHCHAYRGVPAPTAKAARAASETAGEVLAYHGLLIDAQYSAACGGRTVAAWDTRQGKLLPYLSGSDDTCSEADTYCAYDHSVSWQKRFTYAEAQRLVAGNLRLVLGDPELRAGRLRALRIGERSGDRVKWLEVSTTTGDYRVMGDSIRWLFGTGTAGPSGLRSTDFDLKTASSRGAPASFTFTGRGHGHGIGMCQWGARGRAAAGQTAEEILTAYYPGVEIVNLQAQPDASAENGPGRHPAALAAGPDRPAPPSPVFPREAKQLPFFLTFAFLLLIWPANLLTRYASKEARTVIGLMSGTSADGIDAARCRLSGSGATLRATVEAFRCVPYPPDFRAHLMSLFSPDAPVGEVMRMNVALGQRFAEAALAVAEGREIDLIASHGQTICHLPADGATLQIGEPAVIAERIGALVVADFRPRDLAAGGQGAPLVPYADYVLFHHAGRTRAVQNIGGIGNVTLLPAGGGVDDVIAFDTGPGNMVIDGLVARLSGGTMRYDHDGARAARGRVDEALLARLMRHPFFAQPPPKSTGREDFGAAFVEEFLHQAHGLSDDDMIATATALTAESIAAAYREFLAPHARLDEVILGGGGSYNGTLKRMLAERLPQVALHTHEDFGIDGNAKEALAFALLGNETVLGRPANVPSATGASHPVILGTIVLP